MDKLAGSPEPQAAPAAGAGGGGAGSGGGCRAAPEARVLDGFESFEFSQYFPFHFNVLVGARTHFFYAFTESPLRRKGSMRDSQKRQRERLEETLGRPDPKAIELGVAELLRQDHAR